MVAVSQFCLFNHKVFVKIYLHVNMHFNLIIFSGFCQPIMAFQESTFWRSIDQSCCDCELGSNLNFNVSYCNNIKIKLIDAIYSGCRLLLCIMYAGSQNRTIDLHLSQARNTGSVTVRRSWLARLILDCIEKIFCLECNIYLAEIFYLRV